MAQERMNWNSKQSAPGGHLGTPAAFVAIDVRKPDANMLGFLRILVNPLSKTLPFRTRTPPQRAVLVLEM